MPLRSYFLPATRRWQRLSFHSSAVQRQDGSNHYETLQVSPNASHSEVKKYDFACPYFFIPLNTQPLSLAYNSPQYPTSNVP